MSHAMPLDKKNAISIRNLAAFALIATCSISCSFGQKLHAASMRVVTPDANVTIHKGQSTASVRINLHNDEAVAGSLAVWFISMEVVADPTSAGSVQFASVSQPPDYFLEGATPFGPQLVIGGPPPTSHASFSDAALLVKGGVAAAANATANLFDLHLNVSPDALGAFKLIMFPLEGDQPSSSSWSTGDEPGIALAFSNTTLLERTLVEINVVDVPEPALTGLATGLLSAPVALQYARMKRTANRRHSD